MASTTAPVHRHPPMRWQARSFWRGMAFMVVLCSGITLLLVVLDGGPWWAKALYSFCIGYGCWACTDGLRLLTEWLLDRARERRGESPGRPGGTLNWTRFAPLLVIGMAGGAVLGIEVADAISGFRSPSLFDLGSPATRVTLAVTVLATALAWVRSAGAERLAAERARTEQLQRQAAQTQLMLLQSQLEPHMLFNTLANLRVLIGVDPARAQAMLDRLIAFLRATLAASRAPQHPLSAEFERIADYLALMAVRMGPRLQMRLELPVELAEVPVPTLLLQPLVENGIRHGLEPKLGGGMLEIGARRDGEQLVLTVRDTGVGLPAARAAAGSGGSRFGLEQVRERLATLHGSAASLSLDGAADGRGGTLATVRLPLGGVPAGASR